MSEETRYRLEEFISELTAFSSSDILVHVDEANRGVYHLDAIDPKTQHTNEFSIVLDARLRQLLKVAFNHHKIADVHSLCLAKASFLWRYRDKQLRTPFFLFPLKVKINKLKNEANFFFSADDFFINPFIINTLKKEYDIDLFSLRDDTGRTDLSLVSDFLQKQGLLHEFENFSAIGNFHYHRFEMIKDLEEIHKLPLVNPIINRLLGETASESFQRITLSPKLCFDSDPDQEAVFKLLEQTDCVVNGPPGTGKTQFLSNLLTKLIVKDSFQLLVSEKRTALTVLEQKLRSRQLDHFIFVSDTGTKASDFIKKLKKTWQFLEKQTEKLGRQDLSVGTQLSQQLQLSFDKINSLHLFKDLQLEDFHLFEKKEGFSDIPHLPGLSDLDEWRKHAETVRELYERIPAVHLLSCLQVNYFRYHPEFDQTVRSLEQKFRVLEDYFSIATLHEIDDLIRLHARVQLLENEEGKKYFKLLKSKTNQKKFENLKRKYHQTQLALVSLENEAKIWKKEVSLSEVQSWRSILETGGSFTKKILLYRLKQQLLVKVNPELAILNCEKYLHQKEQQLKVLIDLSELGIEKPEHELALIDYFIKQINQIEPNELNQIATLDEVFKKRILSHHMLLSQFKREMTELFKLDGEEKIAVFLHEINRFSEKISMLMPQLISLPSAMLSAFRLAQNFGDFENMVLKASWLSFKTSFPDLAEFNGKSLKVKIEKTAKEIKAEQKLFSRSIVSHKFEKFTYYQTILLSDTSKLKEKEKELKKQLKKGKAILVKEFSKSKQHKNIRELLYSEARIWIELLCPIFLATPGMVSKNFSLDMQFQFVLFDEASQITLPRSLAAIQRGKYLLIAGDEQQMSPSQLFSGAKSSVDLLHQAKYHFPSATLKHHYRSRYSELISFSNRYFYQNELIVYPAAFRPDSIIDLHYVQDGVYENRQNQQEAMETAAFISKQLVADKSIGVVAFSEQQLSAIWMQLSVPDQLKIQQRLEDGTIFFKALEQVQGEECDHLIISFAYGKNKQGEFHKRFGPLNFSTGSKRLNVLFSRSIQKIDLFCSVRSSDFELSTNEAVNLFRLYLSELETRQKTEQSGFPFGLKPNIEGNQMLIKQVNKQMPQVNELLTFHQVMEARGWVVNYQI